MNRRTKRRLIVLAAVGGVIVLAGVGGTAVRKMRRAQMAETARTEGMAAYEAKDYATARRSLGLYVRYHRDEPEVWTALGDAQRYLEEPNAKHLTNARNFLDQAVLLDPQNIRAREILLDIHEMLGNWQEMAEVASDLLELDPENDKAALLRIRANLRRGNEDEAIAAAREFVVSQDGAIEAHLEMLRVLQQSGRSARVQREYLENEVAPKHSGTTSMAVLRATVEYDANQPQRASEILLQAGEAGATDGPGARMLLDSLELIAARTRNTALFDQSEVWLVEWLEREELAPHLLEVAAGRAWRSGQPSRAVDMATRAIGLDSVNESVFGWGLLGAMELGMEGQETANRLRQAFEEQVDEEHANRADRWRQVVDAAARAARGEIASEQPLVPDGTGGINTLGPDAAGEYYDAIDDASRYSTRAAIERLAGLGQQPSWRRARFALAGILLSEGRAADALSVLNSDEGLRLSAGGTELFGDALASMIEASGTLSDENATTLDEYLVASPDNPVLLAAVGRGALVRGETDRAREVAQRLAGSEAAQAAVAAVRFAGSLQAVDAELAEAIIDRVAVTATSPRHIAAAAIGMAEIGQVDEARQLLDRRAGSVESGSTHEWTLARIKLANAIADAQSLDTLERISASNAGDPRVQIEILSATAIWADADRAGQIIARLREAQGEAGLDWRVFEASRLLENDGSIEAANAAVVLLEPVLTSVRGKRDTRAMLIAADAFERNGTIESELQALASAADGNDPLAALPRLIDRLQSLGRSELAATRLRQFVECGNVPPESRAVRLQLLQRQGMHDLAARDVESLATEGYPEYVLLAGVASRSRGSSQPLTELEIKSLDAELAPQGEIYAAQLLARVGRFDEGLARLEALPASSEAGSRAIIIAQYLNGEGKVERALDYLTRHAETSNSPDAWMEAARMLVGQMRIDEAVALLDRAVAALPGNTDIAAFRASIDSDTEATPFDRMARFATSAAGREDANESMRELGAITRRYVAGEIDTARAAQALDSLAKRRATFYPLWPLLIAAYQHLGLPDEAARRARDAMASLPGDPRPARDATQLLLELERFEEALGTAGEWRSLADDEASRAQADMALGIAEYRRGNVDRAIGLLDPQLDRMLSDIDNHEHAARSLAEALTAADRMDEAEGILLPLAQENTAWAAFMASVAVVAPDTQANTDRASNWLVMLTPLLAGDIEGTFNLASSWMVLYDRTEDTSVADRVVALAEDAERSGAGSWQLVAILATALEAKGDFSPAVAAYERALALSGAKVPALLNNAAWLLTSELGEHDRAVALAREAVSFSDDPSFPRSDRAVFHHTLGAALLASGDPAMALSTFDDGLAIADTPSLRLGRIEALLAVNRRTEATESFGRLRPNDTWTTAQQTRYETLREALGP
ncbi:MAG: tetratricopeptide repeat protein [Phycisphaera sp.]|nr:MAG: tetratricopeptide repeat protein [Phycisphaera sp.]